MKDQNLFPNEKRSKMSAQHKALIAAHNSTRNGLKVGPAREDKKGSKDTPLFKDDNPELFLKAMQV